jgi:hypothetical protein
MQTRARKFLHVLMVVIEPNRACCCLTGLVPSAYCSQSTNRTWGLPKEPSMNRTMLLTDSSTAVVEFSGTNVPYMALQPGTPNAVRLGSYGGRRVLIVRATLPA